VVDVVRYGIVGLRIDHPNCRLGNLVDFGCVSERISDELGLRVGGGLIGTTEEGVFKGSLTEVPINVGEALNGAKLVVLADQGAVVNPNINWLRAIRLVADAEGVNLLDSDAVFAKGIGDFADVAYLLVILVEDFQFATMLVWLRRPWGSRALGVVVTRVKITSFVQDGREGCHAKLKSLSVCQQFALSDAPFHCIRTS